MEIFLYRYALVFVGIIAVQRYQFGQRIHRFSGALFQWNASKNVCNEDGRKDIARSGKSNGYLMIRQKKVLPCSFVVSDNSHLTVNRYACNQSR